MRTVIMGDIHLGSPLCRARLLRRVLEEVPMDRLVLNGDIFDDVNFRRFNADHWGVLQTVRALSERIEVVWIRGNHDGPAQMLEPLLGIRVHDDFGFRYRGEAVFVTHGDAYDEIQRSAQQFRELRRHLHGLVIWFDVPRKTAIRLAQRASSVFARAAERVKRRALADGMKRGARWVVVGHTHHREEDEENGMGFFNPSSWLTPHPAFVLFDEDEPAPRLVAIDDQRLTLAARAHARRKENP
jgi:UDP-2,3-diacylglucosamine pyrophosphatase LpxH